MTNTHWQPPITETMATMRAVIRPLVVDMFPALNSADLDQFIETLTLVKFADQQLVHRLAEG